MKIAYVDPISNDSPEEYDINLLENLLDIETIFFTSNLIKTKKIDKVKMKKNYFYHKKRSIFKVVSYIISQIQLLKYIFFNKDIQLIHFQWLRLYSFDYIVLLILKKMKKKVIITAHNVLPHDSGKKYYNIHKKIYECMDGIIVHEIAAYKEIMENFKIDKDKIVIIPHGIKMEKRLNNKERKKIVFTSLGIIKKYKGIDTILEAWQDQELLNNEEVELIIAGRGKIEVKNNYENIKIINKYLTDNEIINIIEKTDVFLLPYKQISQSGVLMKALSYYKPVIVSNVGGLVEPLKIAKVGWVLEKNNSKCLNKKIKEILRDKNELNQIANNEENWEKIKEYYDWKKIGKETSNFYKKVCEIN